ncbi:MAG: DUF998 domain-containing protein [Nocardioidaceae bacterium]
MTGSSPSRGGRRTGLLLLCGAAAGPLFTAVVLVQVLTRDGFDLSHQPLSLLSLGELGWVQVTNFVTAGALMVALALGMSRVLTAGPGRTWAPLLTALNGVGLILGGLFLPDPGLGFPPGTPDGIPSDLSWHGILHAGAPPLAFAALVVCCFVFVRRSAAERRGRMLYAGATGLSVLVLSLWPGQEGMGVRLFLAVAVGLAWTTFVALDLRTSLESASPVLRPGSR